jgi:hypothetical protein
MFNARIRQTNTQGIAHFNAMARIQKADKTKMEKGGKVSPRQSLANPEWKSKGNEWIRANELMPQQYKYKSGSDAY